MQTRIYVVTPIVNDQPQPDQAMLVRATNRTTARSTATRRAFAVDLATQDDLVRLIAAGQKVIEDQEPEEPGQGG